MLQYSQGERWNGGNAVYKDEKYGFYFVHDFNQFEPLSAQIGLVQYKYRKRVDHFYEMIREPTLFIRYVRSFNHDSRDKTKEIEFIENYHDEINRYLKSFNPKNQIIYIANDTIISDKVKLFSVECDHGNHAARFPIEDNSDLKEMFDHFSIPNQKANLKWYKRRRCERFLLRHLNQISTIIKFCQSKTYIHDRQFDEFYIDVRP